MEEAEQKVVSRRFKFLELTKSESVFGEFVCEFVSTIRNYIRGPLEKMKNSPEGLHRQM